MKRRFYFSWSTGRRPAESVLGLIILSVILSVTLVKAEAPHRVGLVVVHGDEVITQCVEFGEEEITGYEVLERSDLDFNVDLSNSMGAAICRIDHKGCTYPAEDCFCQCQDSSCSFWSYWHLDGDDWQFSGLGTSNYEVSDGDVEGWIWGEGTPNRGGSKPPVIHFEEICTPKATDTPVPPTDTSIPTWTPGPTETPEPTQTIEPTDTPEPLPTPSISYFSADRTSITAGESLLLSWDLAKAKAAYLHYDGLEEGVVAPGSRTVSPTTTTVYTLIARNDGGEARAEVTIIVNPAVATPASLTVTTPTILVAPPVAPVSEALSVPEPTATITAVPSPTTPPPVTPISGPAAVSAQAAAPTPQAAAITPPKPASPKMLTPAAGQPATVAATRIAVAPQPTTPLRPVRPQIRRSSAAKQASGLDRAEWLFLYGGMATVLTLFLAAPVVLLGVGWLAWWLRRP